MRELLWANVVCNLRFYSRNRLLWAFGSLFLVFGCFSAVPWLLVSSTVRHFETLQTIASGLSAFTFVLTPTLGLALITSHLRGRSIKMVLTKLCPPGLWLASSLLSAALVSLILHALGLAITATLSFAWGIPFQGGFVFLFVDSFLRSVIVLSYVSFLTVVLHPVVVVLVVVFLGEATFYQLRFLVLTGLEAGRHPVLLSFLDKGLAVVYAGLPTFRPLSDKTETVYASMRATGYDWSFLPWIASYTVGIVLFFWLASGIAIKRKDFP
jgi:hypothetical protein